MQRPGITKEHLQRAGVREVTALEAEKLCGITQSGLWIPYHGLDGKPIVENGKAYGRLRMDRPEGGKKYHQELGTGVHVYVPPGTKRVEVVVEGEFKALSLSEIGVDAIGISGFYGFGTRGKLDEKLEFLLSANDGGTVEFLGDSDTVHNYQFSLAVTKFVEVLGGKCQVLMPRIPLGGPKGVDDCIEEWGEEALARYRALPRVTYSEDWEERRGAAECANALLRAEPEEGLRLAMEQSSKVSGKVFMVLAFMASSPTTQHNAAEYVRGLLETPKRVFNAELKAGAQTLKEQGGSALTEEQGALIAKTIEEGYTWGSKYYFPNKEGELTPHSVEEAKRHLSATHNLTKKVVPSVHPEDSPVEIVLDQIKKKPGLVYVGKVAGYPKGMHQTKAGNFIVTEGYDVTPATEGDWSMHKELLERCCGRDAGEKHWERQFALVMGWLKHARAMLKEKPDPEVEHHGQFLAVVGDAGAGKTWWQKNVLPFLLTTKGRMCLQEGRNIGARFSAEMVETELVVLSDATGDQDWKARAAFAAEIKKLVANGGGMFERKGQEKVCLPVRQRITASANPNGIAALPTLEPGTDDKVIYLWFYPIQLWAAHEGDRGKGVRDKLREQRAAFCWAIDHFEVPKDWRHGRYVVKAWQHPEIIGLAQTGKPWEALVEHIELALAQTRNKNGWKDMTTLEIYGALLEDGGPSFDRDYRSGSLGKFLGLIRKNENQVPFVITYRKTKGRGLWSIQPRESNTGGKTM